MSGKLRAHIRSNIIGYVALFFALSTGSAVALSGSNTVFTDDITDNQVYSADVRNDTLTGGGLGAVDLKPGSVGTSEVANNSLTGTDVNEATLNLAAEGFHVVGSPGEPTFQRCQGPSSWQPFTSQPAFFRDAAGVVHLQGNARCPGDTVDSPTMFSLPEGYRPAALQNHLVIEGNATNTNVVTISNTTGAVSLADLAGNPVPPITFIVLDGITFRCGPSRANGCP